MKLLFKYTSRSRPANFIRGYMSIIENLSDTENYHILVSLDEDDDSMKHIKDLPGNHTIIRGVSKSKIDAINRDVNEFDYDWDILVNMSDDMMFHVKGFDNIIRSYFRVTTDSSLLFHDGNRGDIITMSILGRKYYDRDKYIYHPSYKSVYCDNEATEVADLRGCLLICHEHIFTHLHPAYGKGHMDEQYIHTESFYREDSDTYFRRKQIGFGL